MSAVLQIGRLFLLQYVRQRILWAFLASGLLAIGLGLYFGRLALVAPVRLYLEIAFLLVLLTGFFLVLVFGVFEWQRFLEGRFAQVFLARPVSRLQLLLGQTMALVVLVSLFSLLEAALVISGGAFLYGRVVPAWWSAALALWWLLLLKVACALLSAVIFSSSFLGVLGYFALVLVGYLNEPALIITERYSDNPISRGLHLVMSYLLPNFSHYGVLTWVAQARSPDALSLLGLLLYTFLFAGALFFLAAWIFGLRELP